MKGRIRKSFMIKALAIMFSVALIVPFVGVNTSYAKTVISNSGETVIDTNTGDTNTGDTNSGSNGDINGLEITMENGQIKTSLDNGGDSSSTWATIFDKYKAVILGFSGIATLTFVLLFIKNFLLIGSNSDNPSGRREAINGCLWTGIATALCGSVMIVVGLFWNAFK